MGYSAGFILNGHFQAEINQKKKKSVPKDFVKLPRSAFLMAQAVAEVANSQASKSKQGVTQEVSAGVCWIHGFKAEEGLAQPDLVVHLIFYLYPLKERKFWGLFYWFSILHCYSLPHLLQ